MGVYKELQIIPNMVVNCGGIFRSSYPKNLLEVWRFLWNLHTMPFCYLIDNYSKSFFNALYCQNGKDKMKAIRNLFPVSLKQAIIILCNNTF